MEGDAGSKDPVYRFDLLDAFANYKGVMMCTRPQDKANIVIERTFCSRVTPNTELGVNPNKPAPRRHVKSKGCAIKC